jgi:hypothetical protein
MLEQHQTQLISGLQELYVRIQNGQEWAGVTLEEMCCGKPLAYGVLERLGILKRDRHTECEKVEDGLPGLQRRLVYGVIDFTRGVPWSESDSDMDKSLAYEELSKDMPFFKYPLAMNHATPILPNHSSCQQSVKTVPLAKA